VRCHGSLLFADLVEAGARLQILLTRDALARARLASYELFKRTVRPGDIVAVRGEIIATATGELTLAATSWQVAAKALRPTPLVGRIGPAGPRPESGLGRPGKLGPGAGDDRCPRLGGWPGDDPRLGEAGRPRWAAASETVRVRATVLAALRSALAQAGFTEVETPILQQIHGGANARPFRTHHNAADAELCLRIAPELALKRLVAQGNERVFEIGRSFRNEGVDAAHNPEFTSLEAYAAYTDYTAMRDLARALILACARAVHGGQAQLIGPDGKAVDISEPWSVRPVYEAVAAATGEPLSPELGLSGCRRLASRWAVAWGEAMATGEIIERLYDKLVAPKTVAPTFYLDFPCETSPLARRHRRDGRLAERWDLVVFGMELGTAYSELTDPVDQRARLTAQSLRAAGGDPEAMEVDEVFLAALESGMPPCGGLGLGVDRLIMALTGWSISETLALGSR
jgi:lysyl-tRNA synthetase class 2